MVSHFRFVGVLVLPVLILVSCSPASRPDMVLIPEGSFRMGSDREDQEGLTAEFGMRKPLYVDERPERIVFLPAYLIDRTEVTNAAYQKFVEATDRPAPSHWRGGLSAEMATHPVVFVSWFDARDFCLWIGKRLPTEAEWEKAARGPKGLEFPWGPDYDPTAANTGDAGIEGTSPVGRFPKGNSPYGVDDLVGNVMEWVEDWYEAYPGGPVDNPLYGRQNKVVRGGSYGGQGGHYALRVFYRSAFRQFAKPLERFPDIGFRCAADPR